MKRVVVAFALAALGIAIATSFAVRAIISSTTAPSPKDLTSRSVLASLMPPSPRGRLLQERYEPGFHCFDVCTHLTRTFNVPRLAGQRQQCAQYGSIIDYYLRHHYTMLFSAQTPANYAACLARPSFRSMTAQVNMNKQINANTTVLFTFEFDGSDTGLERYIVQST